MTTSNRGRLFVSGKSLSTDFKSVIIDELVANHNGNNNTMFVDRGAFSAAADKFKVSVATVSNIWRSHCTGCSTRSGGKGQRQSCRKLSSHDLDFIEYKKIMQPSLTSKSLHADLMTVSTTEVSDRTVCRAVKKYLSKQYSFKKIQHSARERFTLDNLIYTETFMDVLSQVDPHRLRFMDESGFRLPEVAMPLYGHAPIGERAIEIVRYHSKPNATLHLLAGIHGLGHYKVTNGTSDSYVFVDFITECVNTVTEYGTAALKSGDILVLDNAPFHHSRMAYILKQWLESQDIDVVFTPRYSPDMNPVEMCFSKIKAILKQPHYGEALENNFHGAIYSATQSINISDMHSFFRHTGYIDC